MGEINFVINGDCSPLVRSFESARASIKSFIDYVEKSGTTIDKVFEKARARDAINLKVDFTNPEGELKKFDQIVQDFCQSLDGYFANTKARMEEMLSVLNNGSTVTTEVKAGNTKEIDDLIQKNSELTEIIRRRNSELDAEREKFRLLADAVRSDNTQAIRQLSQAGDDASKALMMEDVRNKLSLLKEEIAEVADRMRNAQADVEGLSATLKDPQKAFELRADKGQSYADYISEAVQKLDEANARLEEAKTEYNDLSSQQKQYNAQLQEASGHTVRIRTQIMDAREEMVKMIAAGQTGTPQFQRVAEEAGKMRREMALANATMQYFSDPNKNLTILKTGLQGVAGAAGVAAGVVGLFTDNEKRMAEIQAKVASLLSIIVGLETTYNLIKKSSAVMLAVEEVKTWALARARSAQAASTTAATVAQQGLNAAMKANPIGALVSLLAVLAAGAYAVAKAFSSESDAEKKAREEAEAHTKAIREQHEAWSKTVAGSVSKQLLSYRQLQDKWDELGDDLKAKEQFIIDNRTAFNNLGFGVRSVSDAESLLVQNTEAVTNALMARAKAAAYEKVAQEQYEKEIKARLDAEKAGKSVANGGSMAVVRAGDNALARSRAYYNAKQMGYNFVDGDQIEGKWTEQGVERIKKYNKLYMQTQRKAFNERETLRRQNSRKEIESTINLMKQELKAEETAVKQAGVKRHSDSKDAQKTVNEQANRIKAGNKLLQLLEKQEQERKRAIEDLEISTAQAEIDAMETGHARTMKQIDLDFEKKRLEIERSYEELKQKKIEAARQLWEANPANNGKPFDDSTIDTSYTEAETENYRQRMSAVIAEHDRAVQEQLEKEDKANREAINNYLKQFGDYAQQKKAIYDDAKAQICELEEKMQKAVTDEDKEAIDAQIKLVKAGAKEQAEAIDQKFGKKANALGDLFEDASKKSITAVDKIYKKYRTFLEFYNGEGNVERKDLIDLGFTDKEIGELIESLRTGKVSLKDFSDGLEKIQGVLSNKSPWLKFKTSMQEIQDRAAQWEENGEEGKPWEYLGQGLQLVGEGFQEAAGYVETFGNQLSSCFHVDNSEINAAVNGLKKVGEYASNIGKGFQQGGIAGAAVGFGISIVDIFSSRAQEEEQREAIEKAKRDERIVNTIDAAKKSIDKLTDALSKSYGIEALKQSEKIAEEIAFLREQDIKGLQASSDILWSNAAARGNITDDYQAKAMARAAREIANLYGVDAGKGVFSSYGIWDEIFANTSPERLAEILADIRANNHELWGILTAAEGAKDYFEDLADTYDKINDTQDRLNEQLTTTTADDVFEGFLSSLYDLADGSEDVFDDIADNWQKMVNRMVVNNLVGSEMREQLDAWYKELAELQKERSGYEDINGNWIQIDDEEYKRRLEALKQAYNDIVEDGQEKIQQFTEDGIIKPVGKATEEATKYFSNLRESWLSMLTDMEADGEDFKATILDTVFSDLVNNVVLGAKIDVDINGDGSIDSEKESFENFDAYLKDWTERYAAIMDDASLTDQERAEKVKALVSEQDAIVDGMLEKRQSVADSLGKVADESLEEFSNSLDNLSDTILDHLKDADSTAEEMGKEIALDLIAEMLQTMLQTGPYAERMKGIRQLWQDILSGKEADKTIDDVLSDISQLTTDMAADEQISTLTDRIKELNRKTEETKTSFSGLRDSFLLALTDIEGGAEAFSRKLNDTVLNDLIEKNVLGSKVMVKRWGENLEFENFDAYLNDWNDAYQKAVEKNDQVVIEALIAEMVKVKDISIEAADEFRRKWAEIKEEVADNDTTITDMAGSITSALMDLEGNVEDFADSMKRTIIQKLVEGFMVSDRIKPILDSLQQRFEFLMNSDKFTAEEKAMQMGLAIDGSGLTKEMEDVQRIVDAMMKAIGITVKNNTQEIFDQLGSTITSSLTNTETSAVDFVQSITEAIVNELVEAYVATEELGKELAGLKEELKNAMVSGDAEAIAKARAALEAFYDAAVDGVKQYTDAIKKTEEVEKDTTFTGLADSWVSILMDMEATAESWAENVGRMMAQKIIEKFIVVSAINPLLEKMQEQFDEAMSGGDSWQEAVSALSPIFDELKNEMPAIQQTVEECR